MQRNYIYIASDLSHESVRWAVSMFQLRAVKFELEVHPAQIERAYGIASERNDIQQVTSNPSLREDEWYVTGLVSWGSPGVPAKEV
jgi:hypothetical protein